jgi:hypothetical protein
LANCPAHHFYSPNVEYQPSAWCETSSVTSPRGQILRRPKVLDNDRLPVERRITIGKPFGGDEFGPRLQLALSKTPEAVVVVEDDDAL